MAYVTEKRGVYYAVIYEGRNPVSGRERRRWHRCDDHAAATKLAAELTEGRARLRSTGSSLTFGEYLLGQWVPAKEASIAPSTHARPLVLRRITRGWRSAAKASTGSSAHGPDPFCNRAQDATH